MIGPNNLDWSWAQPGYGESADLFPTAGEAYAHAQKHAHRSKGPVWIYCQADIADEDDVSPWIEASLYFWNCDDEPKLVL